MEGKRKGRELIVCVNHKLLLQIKYRSGDSLKKDKRKEKDRNRKPKTEGDRRNDY